MEVDDLLEVGCHAAFAGRNERSIEAVDLLRIAAEDGTALGVAHGDLDGEPRVVVVQCG